MVGGMLVSSMAPPSMKLQAFDMPISCKEQMNVFLARGTPSHAERV